MYLLCRVDVASGGREERERVHSAHIRAILEATCDDGLGRAATPALMPTCLLAVSLPAIKH